MRLNTLNVTQMVKYNHVKTISEKFFLDGKSYKISQKPTVTNMRFNRSNKTIIVGTWLKFKNKGGQKKIYCLNANLSKNNLQALLAKVRKINTYTLRGLWSTASVVPKRSGRISEYM